VLHCTALLCYVGRYELLQVQILLPLVVSELYRTLVWQASLSILGGTNEVQARANDSRIVDVILLDTRGLIVAARGSGDALITVRDVGLATPASASALVRPKAYFLLIQNCKYLTLHIYSLSRTFCPYR
jgi:hypothetical protein